MGWCPGEPPIGRPSTLAVSDLETSSSRGGAKAQTLRCDFEGLRARSHWPYQSISLPGRWDPQIVMDCQWSPGLARWVLLESLCPAQLLYRTGSTLTIEYRTFV